MYKVTECEVFATETYREPYQASTIEFFCKKCQRLKSIKFICNKSSIINR